MARNVTLATMLAEIRWLADVKGLTLRHTDADLTRAINQSIQIFRMKVSNRGIRNYLMNAAGTLTVGATSPFAFTSLNLAALNPAVVRVFGIDITVNGKVRSLEQVDFESRNDFQGGDFTNSTRGIPVAFANYQQARVAILPASDGAYAYTCWYLPVLPDLTVVGDNFDGVAGWEAWIQWDALCKLINRDKYGQDYALAAAERDRVWTDIAENANPVKTGGVIRRYDARGLRGNSAVRRGREEL